ncbi:hypothetical protein BDK51DRAFT_47187, partial [Blyttiomyces helicus]
MNTAAFTLNLSTSNSVSTERRASYKLSTGEKNGQFEKSIREAMIGEDGAMEINRSYFEVHFGVHHQAEMKTPTSCMKIESAPAEVDPPPLFIAEPVVSHIPSGTWIPWGAVLEERVTPCRGTTVTGGKDDGKEPSLQLGNAYCFPKGAVPICVPTKGQSVIHAAGKWDSSFMSMGALGREIRSDHVGGASGGVEFLEAAGTFFVPGPSLDFTRRRNLRPQWDFTHSERTPALPFETFPPQSYVRFLPKTAVVPSPSSTPSVTPSFILVSTSLATFNFAGFSPFSPRYHRAPIYVGSSHGSTTLFLPHLRSSSTIEGHQGLGTSASTSYSVTIMSGVGQTASAFIGANGGVSRSGPRASRKTAAPGPGSTAQPTLTSIHLANIYAAFSCNLGNIQINLAQWTSYTNFNGLFKSLQKHICLGKAKMVEKYVGLDRSVKVVANLISSVSNYLEEYNKENLKRIAIYDVAPFAAQADNLPLPPTTWVTNQQEKYSRPSAPPAGAPPGTSWRPAGYPPEPIHITTFANHYFPENVVNSVKLELANLAFGAKASEYNSQFHRLLYQARLAVPYNGKPPTMGTDLINYYKAGNMKNPTLGAAI